MIDEKTNRERLEKVLEESDLYYVQVGDSWVTRRDDAEVKIAQVGQLVRASVATGVIVNDENRAAIRAMADHLEGWEYKIAFFNIPVDGEVTIYYERQIGSAEDPDGMARRLAHTVREASEKLRRVAAGESPHHLCKGDGHEAPDFIRFMRDHGDLASLLGD